MKDTFKRRFWIGTSVIIVSMIAAVWAFIYFSGAIQTEAGKVVTEKAAAASNATALASLASLEKDAPRAEAYANSIKALLPTQTALVGLNAWIEKIAAKYNVIATADYTGDPVAPAGSSPGTAQFTLAAQGPSGNVIPFLDEIAKDPGFIISFQSFDYTNDRSQESVNAKGTTYFR